jgi:Uma2 family endonuclease
VSRLLQFALMQALEMTRIARVFNAPIDVILSDTTVVQPDLAVVRETRKEIITERGIEAAPDLVVEIFSQSTRGRDEVLKRGLYARFGVPEYWLVDPEYCFVDVLRLSGSGYGPPARFERNATLTSLEFPELSVPLAPVFEDR